MGEHTDGAAAHTFARLGAPALRAYIAPMQQGSDEADVAEPVEGQVCTLCKQPLPLGQTGMSVALDRNEMTLPDGTLVKLQPRQAEFMHVMIERVAVSPDDMVKALYGTNPLKLPAFAKTAVRVVATSLRRRLAPYGYTIAEGRYELKKREP